MSEEPIAGSCLCGAVAYQISGNAGVFQYCHCSRCRKFTGSAHAANLFVRPAQFSWSRGQESVRTYAPADTKYFSTAFCAKCGSALPWKNKAGTIVVVPAGSLDAHPGMDPVQNVFWASRAAWYKHASALPQFDELPPR